MLRGGGDLRSTGLGEGLRGGLGGGLRGGGLRGQLFDQRRRSGAAAREYQRQLLPYVRREQEEDDEERNRRTFVETLIDVLSTGQYLTANIAEDIRAGEWRDPIGGALSGERRGDWEDLIFGGTSTKGDEIGGLIPIDPETAGTAGKLARGAGGFVANVLLDPVTYLTFGGTSAGRAAATKWAQRAVGQARRQLADPEVMTRVFGPRAAGRLGRNASERLKTAGDNSVQQYLDRTYRDAYREALSTPGETLRKRYAERLRRERGAAQAEAARLGPDAHAAAARVKAVDDEIAKVADPQAWDAEFRGLGEVGHRFLGLELTRRQPGPIRQQLANIGYAVRQAVRENPVGSRFLDAWWAVQNTGIVGTIRANLGFRNPYQKYLRELEMSQSQEGAALLADQKNRIREITDKYRPEVQRAFVQLMGAAYDRTQAAQAQAAQAAKQGAAAVTVPELPDLLQDAAFRARAPAGVDIDQEVLPLWSEVKQLTDEWLAVERGMVADGLLKDFGQVANYLPIYRRGESGAPAVVRARGQEAFAPHRERNSSFLWARRQEAGKLGVLLGLPRDAAEELVDQNRAGLVTDLREMLNMRATAHTRAQARATLLTQLRDLGIHVDEVRPRSGLTADSPEATAGTPGALPPTWGSEAMRKALFQAYERGEVGQLGLHSVGPGDGPQAEKFLKGWLFDREVAQLLERATVFTGDQMSKLRQLWNNATSWWKGAAIARPGFHVRNATTNVMLVALAKGLRAFDPRWMAAGLAGAARKLAGDDAALIRGIEQRLGRATFGRALNLRIGDRTVEEWADYAAANGVITRYSQFGDVADVASSDAGGLRTALRGRAVRETFNPLSRKFFWYEGSKQFGTLVESSQRFQLFLLELQDMARRGLAHTDAQIEAAKMNAKKWMLDYEDLTPFEQRVLKPLIPFYTWSRKIVPNVLSMIVQNPDLGAAAAKAYGAAGADGLLDDPALAPEWMRERSRVPVGRGEDGQIVMLDLPNPLSETAMVPLTFPESGLPIPAPASGQAVMRELAGMAHPMVQTLVELATGRDLFLGRSLAGFTAAPRALRVLEQHPKVLQFLDGAARVGWASRRGLGFTDEAGRPREDDRGRLMMDARTAEVLENHAPQLRQIGQLLDGPIWVLEQFGVEVEAAIEQMTGARDDHDGLDEFLRLLSYYAGVQAHQAAGAPQARVRRAADIYRAAQDAYRADRRRLSGAQTVERPDHPSPTMLRTYRRMGLL